MSVWLFPHAQAEENHLSQTCPFALLLSAFLAHLAWCLFCSCSSVLLPAPSRHPRPQRHCKPWHDVTGEEQVSSITSPCLGSAISLPHLRVSMEETEPPPPPSRYPRGGSKLQTKPSAERVMTLHPTASIISSEPARAAACQHLNTKRRQVDVRNNRTQLCSPNPITPGLHGNRSEGRALPSRDHSIFLVSNFSRFPHSTGGTPSQRKLGKSLPVLSMSWSKTPAVTVSCVGSLSIPPTDSPPRFPPRIIAHPLQNAKSSSKPPSLQNSLVRQPPGSKICLFEP